MKRLLTIIGLLAIGLFVQAQNYAELHIEDVPAGQGNEYHYCATEFDGGIKIYAQEGCPNFQWTVNYSTHYTNVNPLVLDNTEEYYFIHYSGCSYGRDFTIYFNRFNIENPFAEPIVWKRQGESITLNVEYVDDYECHWSNDSNEWSIEVTTPGIYFVTITSIYGCGSETFSVEVRDNVELYRATCDLRSNLNQVTWQTTPQQAEYINAVNIYRNTYQLVATVPYLDGSFTDNIGSESTQWQYHIVGVDNEGNECPIPSYWKRTIHLDHVQGTGGGEILQWTPYEEENPAKDVVVAYAIYDVVNGEPNHVMDVGNFTNVYAYNPNDFNGYGTVAAVFAGKDMEDLAFSNLTSEVLGVGETQQKNLSIYPNPTNGTFTVQGAKTLTIYNAMGQVVARSDNNEGKHSLSLAPGVYFIKSDEGSVQKVVVE